MDDGDNLKNKKSWKFSNKGINVGELMLYVDSLYRIPEMV